MGVSVGVSPGIAVMIVTIGGGSVAVAEAGVGAGEQAERSMKKSVNAKEALFFTSRTRYGVFFTWMSKKWAVRSIKATQASAKKEWPSPS